MFKKTCIVLLLMSMILFILLIFVSQQQVPHIRRDPNVLLRKYYKLKHDAPTVAHQCLLMILKHHPDHVVSLHELSQWYWNNHDWDHAWPVLDKLHRLDPLNQHIAEQWQTLAQQKKTPPLLAVNAAAAGTPPAQESNMGDTSCLIVTDQPTPLRPDPVIILKNSAYEAIAHHDLTRAILLMKRAYQVHPDQNTALQLAYWYQQNHQTILAQHYFTFASRGSDLHLSQRAMAALTPPQASEKPFLPTPYFAEFFFTPFTQTRFALTVNQLNARLGVEQHNVWHTREYFLVRRTADNQSHSLGTLTQLYEDDVEIFGVGGQMMPRHDWPVVAFLETGAAFDLVYRNRPRWRPDLRTGLMFYQEYGTQAVDSDRLHLGHDYFHTWYAEMTYFTRYGNTIGGIRTHQGIHLLRYKSGVINTYLTGRVIFDTQRLFFNNYTEIGPGIAWIPFARYNLQLRFEHVRGMYIPAGNTPNPYSHYYNNNILQFLVYIKL